MGTNHKTWIPDTINSWGTQWKSRAQLVLINHICVDSISHDMRGYCGYHIWLVETSGQQQWAVWQYLSGKFRNTVEMTKTTQMRIVQSLSRVRLFCSPIDCSLPGSSVHAISQARIPEQLAITFAGGSFPTQRWSPCLLNWQADSVPLGHRGTPPDQVPYPIIKRPKESRSRHSMNGARIAQDRSGFNSVTRGMT